jgi:hypothetical protein
MSTFIGTQTNNAAICFPHLLMCALTSSIPGFELYGEETLEISYL